MKKLFVFLSFLSLILFSNENLINHGDFDVEKPEAVCRQFGYFGKLKCSIETENLSWNKCLKMELAEFTQEDGRQKFNYGIFFGGEKGFPVTPDTVYNYEFSIKGTLGISLEALLNDKPGFKPWQYKAVRPSPAGVSANPDGWTQCKGSFKTAHDTHFMRFYLGFWADSKELKNMPPLGGYALIDNVFLGQKQSLKSLGQVAVQSPAHCQAVLLPGNGHFLLKDLKSDKKLPLTLACKCDDKSLNIQITLQDPDNKGIVSKAQGNGTQIWCDDVVELFLAPGIQSNYTQFVCAASGGRYHGIEGTETGKYDQWQATCTRKDAMRIYNFQIPWQLSGIAQAPAPGKALLFNVGVQFNRVNYSLAPAKCGFGEVPVFARMFSGSIADCQKQFMQALPKEIPADVQKDVEVFQQTSFQDVAQAYAAAETLLAKIKSARLGSAPFLLARLQVTGNFSLPLDIGVDDLITSDLLLKTARNGKIMLPLALVNRTEKTAAYRVVLHENPQNFDRSEIPGLSGHFPAEQISLREAVPIKDNDAISPELLFDPLPLMNEAQTVTLAPQASTLLWVTIDCQGVPEGKYTGSIRVLPLNEPATFTAKHYKGAMKDYPLELEVLPFDLPPLRPTWFFSQVINENYFHAQRKLGAPIFHISPWAFLSLKFDKDGNITNSEAPNAAASFQQAKKLFQQDTVPLPDKFPKYIVAFGAYTVFKDNVLPKQIKPLTMEWELCWKNYLLAMQETAMKQGIAPEELALELFDEPNGKYYQEFLAAAQIAKATLPKVVMEVTWGPSNFGFTPEYIEAFLDCVDFHVFHALLLRDSAYQKVIQLVQSRKNLQTGLYECNTNIRENLHTYYRLHPWRTFGNHFDICALYVWANSPWGQIGAPDWKLTPYGAISYRAGNRSIPSIRMMALEQGLEDLRYLDALRPYSQHEEVKAFLLKTPQEILKQAHNNEAPDKAREEAIRLILKYH